MAERVLLLGDDLRAFLAIARSPGRRGEDDVRRSALAPSRRQAA